MARPRQVTDEQILAATREAILDVGPQASLDAVAARLGVTSPALLKRFGSRQQLLLAALTPDFTALDRLFELPLDERPFLEQLEALIDRLSVYFAEVLPRVMALRECGFSDGVIHECFKVPMPVRATAGTERWLGRCHEAGLIDAELIEACATAIVGAVTNRMIIAHFTKRAWSSRSQKKHQRELAGLFARALGVRSPRAKKRSR